MDPLNGQVNPRYPASKKLWVKMLGSPMGDCNIRGKEQEAAKQKEENSVSAWRQHLRLIIVPISSGE